jgi:SulP family sulfate permease
MDQLQRAGFIDHLGAERVYLSTHQAMRALDCV